MQNKNPINFYFLACPAYDGIFEHYMCEVIKACKLYLMFFKKAEGAATEATVIGYVCKTYQNVIFLML